MAINLDYFTHDPELINTIKNIIKKRKKAIVITIGNWKGGVSKTASSAEIAFVLSTLGFKVTVIDNDAQGDVTGILLLTKQNVDNKFAFEKTMMRGIQEKNLTDLVVNIRDNLNLIPSSGDFFNFGNYLDYTYGVELAGTPEFDELEIKKVSHQADLLTEVMSDSDFVIIDTPPGESYQTKSALYMSDYVMLALQTQASSLEQATTFVKNFIPKILKFNPNIDIIGILTSMLNAPTNPLNEKRQLPTERLEILKKEKKWMLDLEIYQDALDEFGESEVFNTIIPYMRRIGRLPRAGIELNDRWDKDIQVTYYYLVIEILERINERIGN